MKTNEEIVNKIKEMMFEEHKEIIKCRNSRKECEKRNDYGGVDEFEFREKRHGQYYEMLAKVLVFAIDD